MPPRQLIIIDAQNGFINDWTAHIPAAVTSLQAEFDRITVTRFINPEGSLFRRLMGWQRFAPGSEDIELAFQLRDDAEITDKTSYSCVTLAFLAALQNCAIETVHLCGIATDNCVLKTAVDLFEAGIVPIVHARACASHGGANVHDCGIMLLKRFIGDAQVIEDDD